MDKKPHHMRENSSPHLLSPNASSFRGSQRSHNSPFVVANAQEESTAIFGAQQPQPEGNYETLEGITTEHSIIMTDEANVAAAAAAGGGGGLRAVSKRHMLSPPGLGGIPQAPTLDGRGKLNVKHDGVAATPLTLLTWYHSLMDVKWRKLMLVIFGAYATANVVFACLYYVMCKLCGARDVTGIVALYFNVVSLAANGGYMGEDRHAIDPHSSCYAYRTVLVLIESFTGLIFGGLITAICIAKIAKNTSLRHRIVFSEYATVTTHHSVQAEHEEEQREQLDIHHREQGDRGQKGSKSHRSRDKNKKMFIMFRIAHTHHRPLLNASLTLYCLQRIGSADKYVTRLREIPFSVMEEHRLHPQDKSLLLWYPATILHEVTPTSPFAEILTMQPASPVSMTSPTSTTDSHTVVQYKTPRKAAQSKGGPIVDMQLIAVVSGSDAYTGSNVEGRFAYSASDLLLNYHLRLMHLRDDSVLPGFVSGVHDTVTIDYSSFNQVAYDGDSNEDESDGSFDKV